MIQSNIFLILVIYLLLIIALIIIISCIYSRKERFKSNDYTVLCPSSTKRVAIGGVTKCGYYKCPSSCDNCVENTSGGPISCSLAPSCKTNQTQIRGDCVPSSQACDSGANCASGTCSSTNRCVCGGSYVDISDNCGTPIKFDDTQPISLEMVGYIDENNVFNPKSGCLQYLAAPDQPHGGDVAWATCVSSTPKATRIYPQIWQGTVNNAERCCLNTTSSCPTKCSSSDSKGIHASYLMNMTVDSSDPTLFIINYFEGEGENCFRTVSNSLSWLDDSGEDERKSGGSSWYCGWRISYPGPGAKGWTPKTSQDGTTTYITDTLEFCLTNSHNSSGMQFICLQKNTNQVVYITPDIANHKTVFRFKYFL